MILFVIVSSSTFCYFIFLSSVLYHLLPHLSQRRTSPALRRPDGRRTSPALRAPPSKGELPGTLYSPLRRGAGGMSVGEGLPPRPPLRLRVARYRRPAGRLYVACYCQSHCPPFFSTFTGVHESPPLHPPHPHVGSLICRLCSGSFRSMEAEHPACTCKLQSNLCGIHEGGSTHPKRRVGTSCFTQKEKSKSPHTLNCAV